MGREKPKKTQGKPMMMRAHQTVGESAARHAGDEAGSIQEGRKKKTVLDCDTNYKKKKIYELILMSIKDSVKK